MSSEEPEPVILPVVVVFALIATPALKVDAPSTFNVESKSTAFVAFNVLLIVVAPFKVEVPSIVNAP